MHGPQCPVSPVPEGRVEEDQLQTRTRLRMEDGGGTEGEARNLALIFRTSLGGRKDGGDGVFFMRVGDKGVEEREEKLR